MVAPLPNEPGAPIPRGAIDPELIRLSRSQPKVGFITAAGLVFLCGYFLVRLHSDRHFAGRDATPERVTVADVLGDRVGVSRFIALEGAQPMSAAAIRTATSPASFGLRVVPVRATGQRVWLAMPGDGWSRPVLGPYTGRLSRLSDLPFATSVATYVAQHPRLTFATVAAARAGFSTGSIRSVDGDAIAVTDHDRVALEVVDANTATIVGVLSERLPSPEAWASALTSAGIAVTTPPQTGDDVVRFTANVEANPANLESKLEAAKLWAARVEPVTKHFETTWGALKGSPPNALRIARSGSTDEVIADEQIDLIGLYTTQLIPNNAYVVILGERPDNYWYVWPISICLGVMGAVFVFALIRAVKRDLLPTRT